MISPTAFLTATAQSMTTPLLILFGVTVVFAAFTVFLTVWHVKRKNTPRLLLVAAYVALVLCIVCSLLCAIRYSKLPKREPAATTVPTETTTLPTTEQTQAPTTEPTVETTVETTEAITEPPTEPEPTYIPEMDADSDPANWGVKWEIYADGGVTDSFEREETVSFGYPETYYPLPGIPGFRGDNYRTGANYGTAEVTNENLSVVWRNGVGSLDGWPGVGWTGQPLMVQWDEETKSLMDMKASKKDKEGLVEVISTTLDGHIYFADLEDGAYTREPIWIGQSVKGTAALDPRGYPLLYVGAGLNYNGAPKMYIISLIDNSILYTQGGADPFANRGWYAFDSSPLICAEADTIIWPGESGVLYTIKLNTQYDPQTGALSVNPENIAKTRYSTKRNYTVGYESSIIIVDQYAYVGDNGGMFFCFDVNTMELLWAQDVRDDVNGTPVFRWEDGKGYLYLATSMEYGGGTSYIYKLDAANGHIVWEKTYSDIIYDKDVSGGVLSSPILGKDGTELEGMMITCVSKTPNAWQGVLVALDVVTGEVVWEKALNAYAWSSPVAVYTEDGKGYIILGDADGTVMLMDSTGKTLNYINLGSIIEAAPAVFGNMLVISTRAGSVYGIKIS